MQRLNHQDAATGSRPPTPFNFNLLQSLGAEATSKANVGLDGLDSGIDPSSFYTAFPRIDTKPPSFTRSEDQKRDSAVIAFATPKGQTPEGLFEQPAHDPPRRPSPFRFLRPIRARRKLEKKKVAEAPLSFYELPSTSRPTSFHGISLDIPRGNTEEIRWAEEPRALASPGDGVIRGDMESAVSTDGVPERVLEADASTAEPTEDGRENEVSGLNDQARGQEKQTEPTKPIIDTAQDSLPAGLSADEISISIRLRSMYEHGDENATEWSEPVPGSARSMSPDQNSSLLRPDTPPDSESAPSFKVGKQRPSTADSSRGRSGAYRTSSIIRTPSEVAGGLEDYSQVSGRDVDRYGFIQPSRSVSRASDVSNPSGDRNGRHSMQRVSSSLLLISDAPRQKHGVLRKNNNRLRSSRSVPPPSDSRSVRTTKSQHGSRTSSGSLLGSAGIRSKDQKVRDQASDMLTLPPGLEAIAEQEDAGRTAGALKKREWKREEKWRKMATLRESSGSKGGGMVFHFDTHDPLVVKRTWKGIPDRWRATAWHSFLSTSAKARPGYETDASLTAQFHALQAEPCADDMQIDVDVPRSVSTHVMFRRRYRGGQRLLFRVLHAVALKFADVGYVQGMAAAAATLLCYYDEEAAFVMLVRLWGLRGLRALYAPGFGGLMAALAHFDDTWLPKDVAARLAGLGIDSTAYGTRWYLTLFNMSVPFPAQLRIWDVFMLHGDGQGGPFDGADLDVLHAASAALVDATREILLDAEFETAMKTLTSWIPVKDEDLLMRVAKAEYRAKKRRTAMA